MNRLVNRFVLPEPGGVGRRLDEAKAPPNTPADRPPQG